VSSSFPRARRGLLLVLAVALLSVLPVQTRTTPTAFAAPDPCGSKVPKATGGYWSCTFADSFTGGALDTRRWTPVETATSGFTNGPECYVNSPQTISQNRGVLSLTVTATPYPFTCSSPRGSYTSQHLAGYVSTYNTFAQTYGRFEFRARFPSTKVAGVHSALWLWPVNASKYGSTWPSSGEIDVAEFYSAYPDRAIPYVHYNGDKLDPNATNNNCLISRPEDFHTYVLEWTPQTITVKYDGNVCIVDLWLPTDGLVRPAPFDHPFHLNMTQALGILGNAYKSESTPLPATMQIDHVRVWR
jgi:beta-glucanase (GH16 family)